MMSPALNWLLVFGAGPIFIGLILVAIFHRKFWIIPAVGAIVLLGLMATGVFVARVDLALPTHVSQMSHTDAYGLPRVNTYPVGNSTFYVSGPNWSKILIVAVVLAFVIRRIIRHGTSPAFGYGVRRAWPVVAVILFVGVIFILRSTNESYERAQATAGAARDAAEEAAARAQSLAAREQALAQESAEKIRKQLKIAQKDIHAEMDQFDAPRIPLSPETTSPSALDAPAAPAIPAAPDQPTPVAETNSNPSEKTNKREATKTAATSTHKRKKSDKTPATADAKPAQLTAQSKAAAETIAKKESTITSDKLAMVAEAESDKPKVRPSWVDEPPKRTGNTRREVIVTEPYASVDECYQAADIYLMLKTYQRIQELIGRPYTDSVLPSLTFQNGQILADGKVVSYGRKFPYWADERIRRLADMGLGNDYIRREIVAKDPKKNESREFIETVDISFGPMKRLYLQIEFTPSVDTELLRHWANSEREERFAMFGVGAGSILAVIGLVFGLLKIDTWTKGYYSKRLFIGVPAAIIVGLLLLMSKTIVDFVK